ncbi:MAG: hypothetical protein ACRC1I_22900, partial [Pseudomonas proteolytica]|uniref:hypothetical protein n=1 Tax=Pseudomonas proteolytica TaxID=219574 RepID=UPI003F2A3215
MSNELIPHDSFPVPFPLQCPHEGGGDAHLVEDLDTPYVANAVQPELKPGQLKPGQIYLKGLSRFHFIRHTKKREKFTPAMPVYQPPHLRLTHRHRRQASSHL